MSSFAASTTRYPRASHIGSWLHSWVHGGSLAGASVMLGDREGEIGYFQSGHADEAAKIAISRETIFRVYSMTKPVTSLAAMMLIDRGLLSLEDPIEKWIPEFGGEMRVYVSGSEEDLVTAPLIGSITIQHLMTHTAGFTYGFLGVHPCDKILCGHLANDLQSLFRNTSLPDLCAALAKTPLCFEPGTKWHYGFSTDVLGHVIERVSGVTLPEFLQREIFNPLDMQDTGFFVPADKIHRLAQCYDLKGSNSGYALSTSPERDRSSLAIFHSGGGGLVSTIDDYMKFCQCILHEGTLNGVRLLSAEAVRQMGENHLPGGVDIEDMSFNTGFSEVVGAGVGFGLGFSVTTKPDVAKGSSLSGVGEIGWGGMASTAFSIDPVKNLIVIFMTQAVPSSVLPVRTHLKWLTHWVAEEK